MNDLDVFWLSESKPLRVGSSELEELRVKNRALVLRGWLGEDAVLVEEQELFGQWGPERALVVRSLSQPNVALLVGEEGSELLRLDLDRPTASHVAELPRTEAESEAGYHRLKVHLRGEVILVNWELGVLALDPSFELRWRQDLEWNHKIVYLDDGEIWFDYFYDSADGSQREGVEPYGFSVATGTQLFDRRPPDGDMAQE